MNLSSFDADELLHLAVELTARQQHGEALQHLQQAATLDPAHARVACFTGMAYMQAGEVEPAIKALRTAVDLDPEMPLARFQLGLLLYMDEREAEAIDVWQPLDALGETQPLYLFKEALEALAREEFDACRDLLHRGIAANTDNPSLNDSMRGLLAWTDEEEREATGTSDDVPYLYVPRPTKPKDLPLPSMFGRPS